MTRRMRFNPETGELEDLVAPSSRRASPSGNGPAPSPSPPPTASAAPSSSQVSPSGNGGLGQFIAVGLLCLLIVFVESESVSSFISSTVSSLFELVSVKDGESGENKEKIPLAVSKNLPKQPTLAIRHQQNPSKFGEHCRLERNPHRSIWSTRIRSTSLSL